MSKPLRNGELIRLSTNLEGIYAVQLKETFNTDSPERTVAFEAVVAAGSSGWTDLDDLDPREHPPELLQIHLGFEDGFNYYVKYPSGSNIHGVNRDKDVGFLNSERSPALMPNDNYEYWALHDWYPSVNAVNPTAYTDTPKVYASGYKYTIRPATPAEAAAVKAGRRYCRFVQLGGVQQMEGS